MFLALAVGILIGVGLGDSVVSGTEESISESLQADIDEARAEADAIAGELAGQNEFIERAYPALVGGRLDGWRIGVLGFGDVSPELSSDIESAVERATGTLADVSVVRTPPVVEDLVEAPRRGNRTGPQAEARALERLHPVAVRLGAQLARGRGALLGRLRGSLFVRSSGPGGRLRGVVLAIGSLGEEGIEPSGPLETLIDGMVEGIRSTGATVVAVEREEASPSRIPELSRLGISTVDNVDSTAGKVATVFAIRGASGDFGVKGTAERLLPDLLAPAGRGGG